MRRVPQGFSYVVRDDGEAQISHHGRAAHRAARHRRGALPSFDVQNRDPQDLMARLTGNHKRGNERMGKNHPRTRHELRLAFRGRAV